MSKKKTQTFRVQKIANEICSVFSGLQFRWFSSGQELLTIVHESFSSDKDAISLIF